MLVARVIKAVERREGKGLKRRVALAI